MARKTKIINSNVSQEEAQDIFAQYADADARIQKINAQMDIKINEIREKYAKDLQTHKDVKEAAFDKLYAFAEGNRDLFGKRKSIEFAAGILGFRTGTPKIKTRKGYTWASVLNLMKEYLPSHVRTAEEVAKDRLLADREDPKISGMFDKIGVVVDQDETFFVEPKKEDVAA